jgi:hypothetical protein
MKTKTKAERIMDAFDAFHNGWFRDEDPVTFTDVDLIKSRYRQLKLKLGFDDAARQAKIEFIQQLFPQD